MNKIKINYKHLLLISIAPFMIYYYCVCVKIIIHSEYNLEYVIISLLLMILPLVIYKSMKFALERKYYKSILIILIYASIFSFVLYFEIGFLKDKKIYNNISTNTIKIESNTNEKD
ncbi:hypothetical protein [Clostridium sp. CCUG 7971]|uniref:hypothetical protein n=1 Tax=Clostridium sp. CCUG 7971 TaxID=2811414 RepID=UPI001ABA847F|nr:hypothetical protein [Clostridium sp. CCUG 7971]MBO3446387.1 hypothetical protein [Clostridium sp. CCUG 7971]